MALFTHTTQKHTSLDEWVVCLEQLWFKVIVSKLKVSPHPHNENCQLSIDNKLLPNTKVYQDKI